MLRVSDEGPCIADISGSGHCITFVPTLRALKGMGGTYGRTLSECALVPCGAALVSFVDLLEIQTKIDACPDW